MKLLYDKNDLPHAKKLRDSRYQWLKDLGAAELSELSPTDEGFVFAYQHGNAQYRQLVGERPNILDRPEQREELLCLDDVLGRLTERGVELPTPRTWIIGVDDTPPPDLEFPLFVRTPKSSWKRGGTQARANTLKELSDEMNLLRRAFGWDTPILARQWINVAVAGKFMFGDAPQEVRVWIVDQQPVAWSFHYLHVVQSPKGFPPSSGDFETLTELWDTIYRNLLAGQKGDKAKLKPIRDTLQDFHDSDKTGQGFRFEYSADGQKHKHEGLPEHISVKRLQKRVGQAYDYLENLHSGLIAELETLQDSRQDGY